MQGFHAYYFLGITVAVPLGVLYKALLANISRINNLLKRKMVNDFILINFTYQNYSIHKP
jgi:hypothetical protein